MKSFSTLQGSEGPRREFKITWGLRAGYGLAGRIYDVEEAIRAAHRWMRDRDARGEPFLSGIFAAGKSSTPAPMPMPPTTANQLQSLLVKCCRFTLAIWMMTQSERCSMSLPRKLALSSNRRRSMSDTVTGLGR